MLYLQCILCLVLHLPFNYYYLLNRLRSTGICTLIAVFAPGWPVTDMPASFVLLPLTFRQAYSDVLLRVVPTNLLFFSGILTPCTLVLFFSSFLSSPWRRADGGGALWTMTGTRARAIADLVVVRAALPVCQQP